MRQYVFIESLFEALRFFYDNAALPFTEQIRKIEAGEDPYDTAPGDYDVESGEPPFLEEWNLNASGLTLLGHSVIAMLQVALKLYLDAYEQEVEEMLGKQNWMPGEDYKKVRGQNWFALYKSVLISVF